MIMKAAASLTGSLLARKGAAYPASYAAPNSTPATPAAVPSGGNRAYNDPRVIASAPPVPARDPEPQQQDDRRPETFEYSKSALDLSTDLSAAPANHVDPSDGATGAELPQAMDKMGRVRLSVRLDPDRYLRVKMASARTRWSAQDIVIAALDRYLGGSAGKKGDDDRDDGDVN